MGCPPDPVDVSISYGNDGSVALKEKAERLIPQAKKATQFLVALGTGHPGMFPSEMWEHAKALEKDAAHFSADHLGKTFGYGDFKESYGGYPDMSVLYSHLNESEVYVKKIEFTLCIARDILLKSVRLIGEGKLTKSEQETYREEKELHRLHRVEDKELKLKTIANEIDTCKFVISTTVHDYKPEERKEYAEKLARLEPEYQRILAFTDDELLADRNLF